jgi:pyrimidine-nucleoside phosphorylase
MRAVDIIVKKRDGHELSRGEIEFFIRGFTAGDIPDYQAAAWAMAVLWRGMTDRETAFLTHAMVASGEQLDLSAVVPYAIDKHSTGGVGDKTTLVAQPLVAACGVPVGKMSGRGLSYSGGTLDKMESIPGFRVDLSTEEFLEQLREVGLALCGQTADLAPADGKLYALRDVTGTVPSIPLIASSVMSKKIAAGAQGIVLDVKIGAGAFMHTLDQGRALAERLVEIARWAERRAIAMLSDMNQPLGEAVGNALEVREAVETLRGEGPEDFRGHALEVASQMLRLASGDHDLAAARQAAQRVLDTGDGLDCFRTLVEAQGGEARVVDDLDRLPAAQYVRVVEASRAGFVKEVNAREIGLTAVDLGAGRERKGQPIDHAVGLVIHVNVGDEVERGAPLFSVHANDEETLSAAVERALGAIVLTKEIVEALPLSYGLVESEGRAG